MEKVMVYLREDWPYVEYVLSPQSMDGSGREVELSDSEVRELEYADALYRHSRAGLLKKWVDAGSAEKR